MYFLLGLSIALATVLLLNSLASLVSSIVWKVIKPSSHRWSSATRAAVVCWLRLAPIAFGFACVLLLLLPSYFAHESPTDHESVSWKLAVVAGFSAIGIGVALIRSFVNRRATSKLAAEWLLNATPIELPGINVPAFRLEHRFPVIAVVGMLRPKLFVANQALEALTPGELCAAIQHEAQHIAAYDNLKRSLMRGCRDTLLLIPCGRPLDDAWKEASESAADEQAARGGPMLALDLASALVKISRLIPRGVRPTMPAAALLVGYDEEGSVTERVARLLRLANDADQSSRSRLVAPAMLSICSALLLAMVLIAVNQPHVLAAVHTLMEYGVHLLK